MHRGFHLLVCILALASASHAQEDASHSNGLTPAQRAAGWKLLFDGTSTDAWRGYRKKDFPEKGWRIEEGCLVAGGGGDIITRDVYENFELELDWKVGKGGNSGIMFRVTERHGAPWQTGPEIQILDDAGHHVEATDPHAAGALYDLQSPAAAKAPRPVGAWNHARILVRHDRVRHWLNGVKIVDSPLAGPVWDALVAKSKFKVYEGFGAAKKGHVALQDHGTPVWFKNIRIRDLDAEMPGEVRLFDGKTLNGWTYFLNGDERMEDVWSVKDGVLVCKGRPAGYIRTTGRFKDFVLKLEWRFDPETRKPGNSGVLFRMTGPDKVWPRSLEAQLESGNAGDFWLIGGFSIETPKERFRARGRNRAKTHMAENPVGEWNEYEIVVDGGDVILRVNGEEVNRGWNAERHAGHICLQSEGVPIHFRGIRLAPIAR